MDVVTFLAYWLAILVFAVHFNIMFAASIAKPNLATHQDCLLLLDKTWG